MSKPKKPEKNYGFLTEELVELKNTIKCVQEDLARAGYFVKYIMDNIDVIEDENKELIDEVKELKAQLKRQNSIVYPYPFEENNDDDYEELKFHPNYEIGKKYPYPIRKKDDKIPITDMLKKTLYVRVKIDGKDYLKHRIVALQWIENDDPKNKTEVDHINHDPFNYKKENLRWCTRSENNLNRSGYGGKDFEIVQELPKNCRKIEKYNNHLLTGFYYDGEFVYKAHGPSDFRKLEWSTRKNKNFPFVRLNNDQKQILIFKGKLDKMLAEKSDDNDNDDVEEEDITEPPVFE